MKTLRYKVSVEPGINKSLKHFAKKVSEILNNKKSWKLKFVQDNNDYHFEIILARPSLIKTTCGFGKLSCADMVTNKIYINLNRWIKGSKFSKLNLEGYRNYVINHEVGHILGFDHDKPIKNRLCPVMVQQTLSIGDAKPNPYPTRKEQKELASKFPY